MMMKKLVYVDIFASLWLAPVAVLAQDTGIAGSVSDATGAVLPGVTVEITGPNLGGSSVAFTGGDGAYSVSLPAGFYTVSFNLPGFALLARERVLVAEGGDDHARRRDADRQPRRAGLGGRDRHGD